MNTAFDPQAYEDRFSVPGDLSDHVSSDLALAAAAAIHSREPHTRWTIFFQYCEGLDKDDVLAELKKFLCLWTHRWVRWASMGVSVGRKVDFEQQTPYGSLGMIQDWDRASQLLWQSWIKSKHVQKLISLLTAFDGENATLAAHTGAISFCNWLREESTRPCPSLPPAEPSQNNDPDQDDHLFW